MLTAALIGFLASLLGLAALFFIKYVESRRDVVYAPNLRMSADQHAQDAKMFFFRAIDRIEKIPHDLTVLFHYSVHIGAIIFARVARSAEHGAHRLADRVSHKHQFERNESRSEFLKTISEHKSTLATAPPSAPISETVMMQGVVVKNKVARRKRVPKPDAGLEINEQK